ncbi:MAG: SsrA-binding protein SmpB [Spirochaetota bacterium]|nr:SsrA-binding protein SmpB [Spirochaetota bacterium]
MKESVKIISLNRKAKFDYDVVEKYEAGLVLKGTEVKSVREGLVNLKDSFAKFIDNELWLINAHINEYKYGNVYNHDPTRSRKLLLHKKELNKINGAIKEKGLTLIPLRVYIKNAKIKVELGLCKGKKLFEKRESTKKREVERELRTIIKEYNRK